MRIKQHKNCVCSNGERVKFYIFWCFFFIFLIFVIQQHSRIFQPNYSHCLARDFSFSSSYIIFTTTFFLIFFLLFMCTFFYALLLFFYIFYSSSILFFLFTPIIQKFFIFTCRVAFFSLHSWITHIFGGSRTCCNSYFSVERRENAKNFVVSHKKMLQIIPKCLHIYAHTNNNEEIYASLLCLLVSLLS